VSSDGGEEPLWSPKGDQLFYRQGDKMMSVAIVTDPEFRVGPRRVVFEQGFLNLGMIEHCVDPSGTRFLVPRILEDESDRAEPHLIINFDAELRRLVPVDRE
jgi:hypothetical protein